MLESGGGGAKRAKKTNTERLARNLDREKQNPKHVSAGQDNGADILHEARFLPGPTCKQTEVWLQARRTLGLTGVEPVSKYDSEGMGISGRINSIIWTILHNPGAKELGRYWTFFSHQSNLGNRNLEATPTNSDSSRKSLTKSYT
jgi:hypothetical protein